MCEPYHSIVQYPDQDDHGPTQPRLDAATHGLKGLMEKGKKILRWFHFSKMGAGHSVATPFNMRQERSLPRPTSYEALWWNRTVHRDGEFRGEAFDMEDALESAEEYANRTSIGSLTQLRQFLETSLQKTNRQGEYLTRFVEDFLNAEGREAFHKRSKKVLGLNLANHRQSWDFLRMLQRDDPKKLRSLTKFMLGYTRKRALLVPAWADDDSLWTPGQNKGLEVAPA